MTGREHDGAELVGEFTAVWNPLAYFRAGTAPLYPEGLLELPEASKAEDCAAE